MWYYNFIVFNHYLGMGQNLGMGHYYLASIETVALFVCIPSHYINKLPNLI